jgi:hypothetical protein
MFRWKDERSGGGPTEQFGGGFLPKRGHRRVEAPIGGGREGPSWINHVVFEVEVEVGVDGDLEWWDLSGGRCVHRTRG